MSPSKKRSPSPSCPLFKGEWGLQKLAERVELEIFHKKVELAKSGRKGSIKKVGRLSNFFSIFCVQKLYKLGKMVLSPLSFDIFLLDITPFWSLAHPLVNYDLPDYLLLSYNKLICFATFTELMNKPNHQLLSFGTYVFMLSTFVIS